MPEPKKSDDIVAAVQALHRALGPLIPEDRGRALASVGALLEIQWPGGTPAPSIGRPPQSGPLPVSSARETPSSSLSLVELLREKNPGTNIQRIVLFAYYREKIEGLSRFSRSDLEPYFSKAKEPPPANYDRDFTQAVKEGWIHEDGSDSYLTSKGIEIVEGGFAGARKYTRSPKLKGRQRGKKRKGQKRNKNTQK